MSTRTNPEIKEEMKRLAEGDSNDAEINGLRDIVAELLEERVAEART